MIRNPLIVGVMGGGSVDDKEAQNAYQLGKMIADRGWILLNGGRDAGVMTSSARGARENGGITIGILPDETARGVSPFIQIPVLTGMGNARNCINVLSSHVVVACPGGAGTISEIALALKSSRPVILLDFDIQDMFARYVNNEKLFAVKTPGEAIGKIKDLFE